MRPEDPSTPGADRRLRWRDRALLLLICLALLVPGVFGVSLTDRDEGWYAQVSREMLEGGDWLVPHYLGEPWLAKPPLLYWCVAAAFAAFGPDAWAARLVSVLAMTGAIQLLATLAAELYGRRAAMIAGLSFSSAGLPLIVGKLVLTDALLLLWCLAASMLLWRVVERGATVARAAGFWICVGLAALTKGPAVVLFVGAFAVGLLLWPGGRARLLSAKLWLAFPLCLLVAAPWYAYIASQAGGTFAGQFLWSEIAARIAGAPHGQTGPPGYYLVLSLAGWLPWTALMPGAFFETWRARREDRAAWPLLIWCGLPWLVLELVTSKLPHYILPCYVPLAIMLGRTWDVGLRQTVSRSQRTVLYIWAAVPMALGLAMAVAAVAWRSPAWSLAAGVAGIALLLGFVMVAWQVRRERLMTAWRGAVGTSLVFSGIVGCWLLPSLEPHRLSRQIAEQANRLTQEQTEVLVCGYEEPTMFFYLDRPARLVHADKLAALVASAQQPRILIAREQQLRAAGMSPEAPRPGWHRLVGFNYVKGRRETVWVVQVPQPASSTSTDRSPR